MTGLSTTSAGPITPRPSSSRLERAVQRSALLPRWAAALGLAALCAAAFVVAHLAGGSRTAMPHLFYLPIILAPLVLGLRGALVTALAAALLAGPLLPLDTTTGEPQELAGWLVRGVVYVVVGTAAALSLLLRERVLAEQLSADVRSTLTLPTGPPQVADALVERVPQVLADGAFRCVYQPIYSLDDGRLVAVEVLARFDAAPEHGPTEWFAAAARAGVAAELELAVIERALMETTSPVLADDVLVSVNASPATLAHPDLLPLVQRHRQVRLNVEITEHAVIEDYPLLRERLTDLRVAGAQIAVDDAGAGFASLRHIVQIAPDIIKLDISLTQDVGSSPLRRALAGSLIEFADRTGALLVVEGIESEVDLSVWSALGAHAVQGFLVGRPGALPPAPTSAVVATLRGR